MKNFFLYSFLFISCIFSLENLEFKEILFSDNYKNDDIFLKLEPFNISTFIIDKFYPNSFIDYSVGSCKIDGSMRLPIYQSIPKKLYFNRNNNGTFTQLSYKQKKSDLFFDTNITFKTDINEFTNMVLKAESKSIYSNINQNYHLSVNNKNKNDVFKFDYMYHIEEDPSIEFFENINFNVESFHGGYSYLHNENNFIFESNSAVQFSNNTRYQNNSYNYDYQAIWMNNNIYIPFKNSISIELLYSYKKYIIEYDDNSSYDNSNDKRDIVSFNINYFLKNNFDFKVGYDSYMKKGNGNIMFKYKSKKFILSLNSNNKIIEELIDFDNPKIKYRVIKNSFCNLLFNKNKTYTSSITYGKIYSDSFLEDFNENYYYYYHLNVKVNTRTFLGGINYYNYSETNILNINSFSSFELTYSPIIQNKRFRPYGKIFGNHYGFNENKELNLNSILLYDSVNSLNDFIKNVNMFNFEFGFVFDSFKISYVKLNPNIEELEISNSIKFISYDYINLVWIFKD